MLIIIRTFLLCMNWTLIVFVIVRVIVIILGVNVALVGNWNHFFPADER